MPANSPWAWFRPKDLAFHIRQSIEQGHAERIGHGASVMNERDAVGLLREMARAQGAGGNLPDLERRDSRSAWTRNIPCPSYMRYGVPVALATDDQGVSRSDMTHEYLRAAETYNLNYSDLKRMARQSLEHSFLKT